MEEFNIIADFFDKSLSKLSEKKNFKFKDYLFLILIILSIVLIVYFCVGRELINVFFK